jgi:hypothetical protein
MAHRRFANSTADDERQRTAWLLVEAFGEDRASCDSASARQRGDSASRRANAGSGGNAKRSMRLIPEQVGKRIREAWLANALRLAEKSRSARGVQKGRHDQENLQKMGTPTHADASPNSPASAYRTHPEADRVFVHLAGRATSITSEQPEALLGRAAEPSTAPTALAAFRGRTSYRYGTSRSRRTPSCDGRSSTGVGISPRWRNPSCSSPTY